MITQRCGTLQLQTCPGSRTHFATDGTVCKKNRYTEIVPGAEIRKGTV